MIQTKVNPSEFVSKSFSLDILLMLFLSHDGGAVGPVWPILLFTYYLLVTELQTRQHQWSGVTIKLLQKYTGQAGPPGSGPTERRSRLTED